jgi:hypothetical protein
MVRREDKNEAVAKRYMLGDYLVDFNIDRTAIDYLATFYYEPTKTSVFGKFTPVSYLCQKNAAKNVAIPACWKNLQAGQELAYGGETFVGLNSMSHGVSLTVKTSHFDKNNKQYIFGITVVLDDQCALSPQDCLYFLTKFAKMNIDEFLSRLNFDKKTLESIFQHPVCRQVYENNDRNPELIQEWMNLFLRKQNRFVSIPKIS